MVGINGWPLCVFTAVCVHFGWVNCRALILNMVTILGRMLRHFILVSDNIKTYYLNLKTCFLYMTLNVFHTVKIGFHKLKLYFWMGVPLKGGHLNWVSLDYI